MTCPARFCMDRLGALATKVSPVSFKPPQNDNIPLRGRRWKAIAKMTLSWKLLGGEFTSNFLSCPLDFVHKIFFFLKRTMIISKLRGSSGCGCLPRYVAYSSCVTVIFIRWWWKQLLVWWEWANNAPENMENATLTTCHRSTYITHLIIPHPNIYFQHLVAP